MHIDARGGHNRKSINKDFFKLWSPSMAYVLGLISADGAVEDVRNSSRTCYFTISSVDKSLIIQVKKVLNSSHRIYIKEPRFQKFKNGSYFCTKQFILRIGSKNMFQDLVNLGVTPRKSLRLTLPKMSDEYFRYYLRGYFDGDGCVHVSLQKGYKIPEIITIFTSGCKSFLDSLNYKLHNQIGTPQMKVNINSGAFRLRYREKNSLKILSFIYEELNSAPYLARKYKIYQSYLKGLN